MGTLWFCLVALMIAAYVLLDGFDLGAGILHLFVARSDGERREVLASIGPVWDGNEVWLLAAGGTLYFAFPALYASGFSGFYLPLMIVLWLLILRGISIEFRSHIHSPVWEPLWDAVFCFSSLLLAVFYGAALGNVVRGVPLDAQGYFFEPLWTNFRLGGRTGILDWYTILIGVTSLFALTQHGAAWLLLKTSGAVQLKSRAVARRAWWGVVALTIVVTWFTFRIQPQISTSFAAHPWGYVFPAIAVAGLVALRWFLTGADRCSTRTRGVFGFLRVFVGHAHQRGVWPVSVCPARQHQPGLQFEHRQRKGRGVWIENRLGLVVHRHRIGDRVFCDRVSALPGQGEPRGAPRNLLRARLNAPVN